MVFLGDSRVSRLENAWAIHKHRSPGCPPGWEARFIEKKGCRLDELPFMLGLQKNMDPTLKPDLIIVCGFLVDVIKMERCRMENEGKYLKLRPEVDDGEFYPAEAGFRKKVRMIWLDLKKNFREAKIVWTIPHPVDCERWRHTRGMRDAKVSLCMTWEDHCQCQGLSYRLSKYFERLDELLLEEFQNGFWTIPWVVFWRKQCRGGELSYDEWRTRCLEMKIGGFFNESGSEDGLHPSPGSCAGVLQSVINRMRKENSLPTGALCPLSPPKDSSMGQLDTRSCLERERSLVNSQKMMELGGQPRLHTISVGVQTDPIRCLCYQAGESGMLGDQEEVEVRSSPIESMTVLLACLHVRVVSRGFWLSLVDIPCLECSKI